MNTTKNIKLILETILIFVGISFLSVYVHQYQTDYVTLKWFLYAIIILFQGLWFYRFYIVGHESSHKKLFPSNQTINDIVGSLILLPLMTPINVYRKIHMFHHAFNRKDNHTSVIDTFRTKHLSFIKKIYFYALWYIGVFFGGLFVHSLISMILFLFIPPKWAQKISPAFNGWTLKDQGKAILLFSLGIGFHWSVYYLLGQNIYLWTLGYPLLSFAWFLSLFIYMLHYKTTVSTKVKYNVRSVKSVPILSWILMNFNEHTTHHQYPNIPWYELPEKRVDLPKAYADKNQNTWSFFKAAFQQIKGPRIIDESKN